MRNDDERENCKGAFQSPGTACGKIGRAREMDLAEQLQMAEDAEKMKFIEKNKISLDRLILLNKVSEEEIMRLLKEKEQKEAAQSEEREAYSHEEQEVII